jgi:hypothetical protein
MAIARDRLVFFNSRPCIMFGNFQQSQLRIEIAATRDEIARSLLYPEQLQTWLWPQQFTGAPDKLVAGAQFTSHFGPIVLRHQITRAEETCLRSLLAESIDGFHEWYWGDGWVQSRLEGVSLLPLKLVQSLSLLRLQARFNSTPSSTDRSASTASAPPAETSTPNPATPQNAEPSDTSET